MLEPVGYRGSGELGRERTKVELLDREIVVLFFPLLQQIIRSLLMDDKLLTILGCICKII